AAGDGVPRARLEETRRAGMVLGGAGPEDAALALDALPGDAGVVGDAAGRRPPDLVEDLARSRELEAVRPSERAGDVLDDAPVLTRIPRARDRPVDLDDAPLRGGDRPLVLLLLRPGQHDVRVARGVVQEEVDRDVELETLELGAHEVAVGERHQRVEAHAEQAADLPGGDLAERLVGVDPGVRQRLRVDAPHRRHVGAVLRVLDVAAARKLIALLSVLPAALAVALSRDRRVPAVRPADAPRRQHEVDGAEDVLHAVTRVLDAPRVHEKARAGGAAPPCALADSALRDAGDVGGA